MAPLVPRATAAFLSTSLVAWLTSTPAAPLTSPAASSAHNLRLTGSTPSLQLSALHLSSGGHDAVGVTPLSYRTLAAQWYRRAVTRTGGEGTAAAAAPTALAAAAAAVGALVRWGDGGDTQREGDNTVMVMDGHGDATDVQADLSARALQLFRELPDSLPASAVQTLVALAEAAACCDQALTRSRQCALLFLRGVYTCQLLFQHSDGVHHHHSGTGSAARTGAKASLVAFATNAPRALALPATLTEAGSPGVAVDDDAMDTDVAPATAAAEAVAVTTTTGATTASSSSKLLDAAVTWFMRAAAGVEVGDVQLSALVRAAEARTSGGEGAAAALHGAPPLRHRLEYYEALMRILEGYGCADGARCFAYAAVAELDSVYNSDCSSGGGGGGEAEDRAERGSRLWHTVFTHCVAAGRYEEAYVAALADESEQRRGDSIRSLVHVLCEKRQVRAHIASRTHTENGEKAKQREGEIHKPPHTLTHTHTHTHKKRTSERSGLDQLSLPVYAGLHYNTSAATAEPRWVGLERECRSRG
jgi:hypothetical protein